MIVENNVVTNDLDRLAERVEKAAALVVELRGKLAQAEQEKAALTQQFNDQTTKLQGNDPDALVNELAALKKEQRDLLAERKDVANRIETILKKLDRLEA